MQHRAMEIEASKTGKSERVISGHNVCLVLEVIKPGDGWKSGGTRKAWFINGKKSSRSKVVRLET